MDKKIKKGYILEVTSWENDGDNYRTTTTHFDKKEEAIDLSSLCSEIFLDEDNGGIGNSFGGEEMELRIIETLFAYPELLERKNLKSPKFFRKKIIKNFKKANKENFIDFLEDFFSKNQSEFRPWIHMVLDYSYDLLGSSDYYSRVYEESKVYKVPQDILLKEV